MSIGALTNNGLTSSLASNYRKVYASAINGFKVLCEEYDWLDDFPEADITPSPREQNFAVDLAHAVGVAAIPEGGIEANPYTPPLYEAQASFTWLNARFRTSRYARAFDKKARDAQVRRQLKHQVMKRMEALANRVGFMIYGYSTGIVATVASAVTATTATVTLLNAFGDTNLTQAAYLDQLIHVGEQIAVMRGAGTLVANSFGEVTGATKGGASSIITVVFSGATTLASGDSIVFANNAIVSGTLDLTNHSDYNKWQVGFKDAIESTSVHGLSSTTLYNWAPALNNSTAGRFTPTKLARMRTALANFGDADLASIAIADGVWNDLYEQQQGMAMFTDFGKLGVNGSLDFGSLQVKRSRKVPPGTVIGWGKGAVQKVMLTPKPAENDEGEIDKEENRASYLFGADLGYLQVTRARRKLACFRNQTEITVV